MKKYKLAYDTWDQKEISAIQKVLKSKKFTMGANVKKFENEFSNFFGLKYSVMVNSGSSANLLAAAIIKYLKLDKNKNEIIVPGISWATTYSPFINLGYKLVFVDVNLKDFNINFDLVKRAITNKTAAIVAVNILGAPADLVNLRKICNKKKIVLVEDNCESMGAKIKNKFAGTFGDINTHSFFFSHHLSTMEGGMLSTNNKTFYHAALSLRAHGWTRDLPKNTKVFKRTRNDFYEAYRFIFPGFNLRPIEIMAAAGRVQLKKLKHFLKIRNENYKVFHKLFANSPKFFIQQPKKNNFNSSFNFPMVLKEKYKHKRLYFLNKLKKAKIDHRIVTGGCYILHDVMKNFSYRVVNEKNKKYSLPVSEYIHKYGFFVGNGPVNLKNNLLKLYKILSKD